MQSSNLYVGNLSYSVTSEQLKEHFGQYGAVKEAKVIGDRGFGFVEFENAEDAAKAVEALNETEFEGRTLKVNEARPRQDRPKRGGFQQNRGGGGGGYKRY